MSAVQSLIRSVQSPLTSMSMIVMNQVDDLNFQKHALQRRRGYLLQEIASCADQIKRIDDQLAVIQSCQLEFDLNQAAEVHS